MGSEKFNNVGLSRWDSFLVAWRYFDKTWLVSVEECVSKIQGRTNYRRAWENVEQISQTWHSNDGEDIWRD